MRFFQKKMMHQFGASFFAGEDFRRSSEFLKGSVATFVALPAELRKNKFSAWLLVKNSTGKRGEGRDDGVHFVEKIG